MDKKKKVPKFSTDDDNDDKPVVIDKPVVTEESPLKKKSKKDWSPPKDPRKGRKQKSPVHQPEPEPETHCKSLHTHSRHQKRGSSELPQKQP